MRELRNKLERELHEIAGNELTIASLDVIDKLTHSIKSIDTIMAMEGYSDGSSYRRGRDSMGRYVSRDGRDYSGDRDYSRDRSGDRNSLMHELKTMMHETDNEDSKKLIESWMRQIDSM